MDEKMNIRPIYSSADTDRRVIGYAVDGHIRRDLKPLDRETLMKYVREVTTDGHPDEITAQINHLLAEAVEPAVIFDLLFQKRKQKQATLTLFDVEEIVDALTVDKPTPRNRARWKQRFDDGRVSCLCPACGYSGSNFEHFDRTQRRCPVCFHSAFEKYFTRKWSTGEQQAYETKQAARSAEYEAKLAAERKNREIEAAFRPMAVEVVREIRKHEWGLIMGEFPFKDTYKDCEIYGDGLNARIRYCVDITTQLMLLTRAPADAIVEFYKANLQPDDIDDDKEFRRVANLFVQQFNELNEAAVRVRDKAKQHAEALMEVEGVEGVEAQ